MLGEIFILGFTEPNWVMCKVTNTESSFLKLPNSLAELFNRFCFQITHAGLIPFIVTFFSSLIVFIYKIKKKNNE